MCGLTGFFQAGNRFPDAARSIAKSMSDRIVARGPDDSGVWLDADAGIVMAHRRLSVLDLSLAGHQPMLSASGRHVIAFNGEIYNHAGLREELQKVGEAAIWHGHSDTETLLAGFDRWGISTTIQKAIGMFAFAVWDTQTRTLTLGRDRLGEKPLYYGWQGETFLFGSELKALRAHPAFRAELDRGALTLLMRHNYIPAPYSIYQGISKLPPGCLLSVSLSQREPRIVPFWSAKRAVEAGLSDPFKGSASEAVSALEALLMDAVGQQMVADVPLGAFLSGGVDSSTVVALMQAQSTRPVRTFSIGFDDELYNEAKHAKAVAQHLGTDHTEMYVSSQDALDVIPRLPQLYDEPFADSSQIPTFLVSQIARQQVTVSLSGDAGDELFCGYNRYLLGDRLWRHLSRLPVGLRRGLARALMHFSPQTWNMLAQPLQRVLPARYRLANWGDKLHKGAGALVSRTSADLYRGLVSHWENPSALVLGGAEPGTVLTDPSCRAQGTSDVEQMMALDLLSYLPDDILCKLDRAAMAVSLETRVPFLDHRVVEFAWRLPLKYKLREGVSKWALRQILHKHVPKALIERPKMGFGVPIDNWLRGPLREWAEALLDESRLTREGFFRPEPIRRKWREHLSGARNWQYHLWDVMMFQAWLDRQAPS
jgi:asparagine synthase (glutamine-hydrolysing)